MKVPFDFHLLNDAAANFDKIKSFYRVWTNSTPHIIQKTSGSTGNPKEIRVEKSKMKQSAKMTLDHLKIDEGQSALLCMDSSFIGGKMMIVRSFVGNLKLVIAPVSSNPVKYLETQIDFAAMVPFQVETILRENPEKLNYIKNLIIGGAPLSHSAEQSLLNLNCQAFATFGMTETVSHVALRPIKKEKTFFEAVGDYTFNTNNKKCLVISSPSMDLHQLNTNDVVKLIDKKTFEWLGRKDFIINSGGIKIHPERVEEKLKPLFKGIPFIISSEKDRLLGEKVILITTKKGKSFVNTDKWKTLVDKFEVPKSYYFVNEIYYTESGKIDRLKSVKQLGLD